MPILQALLLQSRQFLFVATTPSLLHVMDRALFTFFMKLLFLENNKIAKKRSMNLKYNFCVHVCTIFQVYSKITGLVSFFTCFWRNVLGRKKCGYCYFFLL